MPDQSYAATEHALLEEIITPLERLAADPLELVEADFPAAMRGYDKAAVDDYVHETSRLVAELQAVRSPESPCGARSCAGGQISGVLRRAHETAAEITATSRSEAEDRLERARVEADEIRRRPNGGCTTSTPTPTGSGWTGSGSWPTSRISPAS